MTSAKKVGTILKTKGFDGTTVVSFDYPILEANFKALFISKGSMYLPLIVEKIEQPDDYTLLIKWKNYNSKEEAQLLHNKELFLDEKFIPNYFDEEELDEFIGYEVYNREEKLGEVIDLYQTNQQETLEIKLADNKKLLVPLIEEFVVTIDDEKSIIYCELSKEFIEMFSSQ
jgi:16S rRNA processing protein RimM